MLAVALALLLQQPDPQAELEKKRDAAAKAVEAIRGAAFASAIPVRMGERKEYGQNALDNARLLYGEDLGAAERALKALGLVGGRISLEKALPILAMSGRPQVFYRKGELLFLDPATPEDELVYKLTVALLDQKRDYRGAAAKLGSSFDAQLALAAVHQGDADMTKRLYWAKKKLSERHADGHLKALAAEAEKWEREDSKWASAVAPRILVRAGDFLWRRGGIFMEAVRDAGGIEAVEKVYGSPPASTEQVLHPEKYGKEPPAAVDAKPLEEALVAAGWKLVYRSTLGELGTAIFLETHLKDAVAKQSEGWGGDAVLYFEKDGKGLAAWATEWDSADDAVEFQAAAQRVSLAMSPSEKDVNNLVLRRGTSVAVLLGVPKGAQDALLEALWKCTIALGEKKRAFGQE
jgi:hypothetical protein